MLGLRLRIQSIASQLQVLDFVAHDLNAEHLLAVAQKYLPKRVLLARNKGLDLNDIYVLWEILGIDATLLLEDKQGKMIRVAISLFEREEKARDHFYILKNQQNYCIRQELNIEQHWLFVVQWKYFPQDNGEWVDLLYHEIDTPATTSGCRLIILS
jgi:hypothetical protein